MPGRCAPDRPVSHDRRGRRRRQDPDGARTRPPGCPHRRPRGRQRFRPAPDTALLRDVQGPRAGQIGGRRPLGWPGRGGEGHPGGHRPRSHSRYDDRSLDYPGPLTPSTDGTQRRREGYVLTSHPGRVDVGRVHAWLSDESYWAKGRERAAVERSIAGSRPYSVYAKKEQAAFARVVTDAATFAWICDVFVAEPHRGRGLGTWLVQSIVEDLAADGVTRFPSRHQGCARGLPALRLHRHGGRRSLDGDGSATSDDRHCASLVGWFAMRWRPLHLARRRESHRDQRHHQRHRHRRHHRRSWPLGNPRQTRHLCADDPRHRHRRGLDRHVHRSQAGRKQLLDRALHPGGSCRHRCDPVHRRRAQPETLATQVTKTQVTERRTVPSATYRLQVTSEFNPLDAAAVTGYLSELGVGAVYVSPLLRSTTGSSHGYDVVDHRLVDPGRGGDAGLAALSQACRAAGLGLVVDIVPNHMGVAVPAENHAWWDVLRLGQKSAFARWFDIDWQINDGRILIPVLGDDANPATDLTVGGGELHYFEHRY